MFFKGVRNKVNQETKRLTELRVHLGLVSDHEHIVTWICCFAKVSPAMLASSRARAQKADSRIFVIRCIKRTEIKVLKRVSLIPWRLKPQLYKEGGGYMRRVFLLWQNKGNIAYNNKYVSSMKFLHHSLLGTVNNSDLYLILTTPQKKKNKIFSGTWRIFAKGRIRL